MINKGLRQHRFKQNPLEWKFAEMWEYLNIKNDGRGVLDYLLAEDINRPCGEKTDRDKMVAATVIQWLGSPVGQNFLEQVKGS